MSTPYSNTDLSIPIDIRYQGIAILIVDDEVGICDMLTKALSRLFTKIDSATSVDQAENLRKQNHYDLIILDVKLPGRSGLEWFEAFDDNSSHSDVIFITGYANLDTSIKALKLGASDFILKPFNLEQIFNSVKKCVDKRIDKRVNYALQRDVNRYMSGKLIGSSETNKRLHGKITQYAPSKATVLIEGESGSGKELVARELHQRSGRNGPFVPINCAAMDASHLVNELLGHIDTSRKDGYQEGLFQIANGGTLFLDEVSELPPSVQSSLLRVLEEQVVRPHGSSKVYNINVRIIASTNKDLRELVHQGSFRQDLYYRLNVLNIMVAPLRERIEDLQELINYFNQYLSKEQGRMPVSWSENEIGALKKYYWPGNIRELKNLIERCVLTGKPVSHHWNEIVQGNGSAQAIVSISDQDGEHAIPLIEEPHEQGYPDEWALKDVEKAHILQVMDYCYGNKTKAAKILQVSRKTLDRKFKEWDLNS